MFGCHGLDDLGRFGGLLDPMVTPRSFGWVVRGWNTSPAGHQPGLFCGAWGVAETASGQVTPYKLQDGLGEWRITSRLNGCNLTVFLPFLLLVMRLCSDALVTSRNARVHRFFFIL